jgi:glycosyltransferase involved in cell wall biosynthesis
MNLAIASGMTAEELHLPVGGRRHARARVAYLVSKYPAPSHTFIRREIDALRRRGVIVDTFSIRRPTRGELQSETDRREYANTWYVRPANLIRLLAAHVLALMSTPRQYVRTLHEALRHRVPGLIALAWALLFFGEAIVLAFELRRRRHVHLHNHFANDGGTVGYLATTYLGISWSLTLHGTSEFDYPSVVLLPPKIRAAAFVACVSHFGRAQAMRVVEPDQWSKLLVVRCGVELDSLPERHRPTDRALVRLISVGRLSAEKGHVGLIAAFAKAIERGARAELRLIGAGPERAHIQQEIHRHRLESHCLLLGRLPELAVLRELAGADLFVLASFMEGLPVVLMEALGLRVPVIAPRVAGIPELVEHGETGLLFSPANWDELTEHMMTLVKDQGLRDKLADAGRARVEAGFDITRAVEPLYHRFVTREDESSRAPRW